MTQIKLYLQVHSTALLFPSKAHGHARIRPVLTASCSVLSSAQLVGPHAVRGFSSRTECGKQVDLLSPASAVPAFHLESPAYQRQMSSDTAEWPLYLV